MTVGDYLNANAFWILALALFILKAVLEAVRVALGYLFEQNVADDLEDKPRDNPFLEEVRRAALDRVRQDALSVVRKWSSEFSLLGIAFFFRALVLPTSPLKLRLADAEAAATCAVVLVLLALYAVTWLGDYIGTRRSTRQRDYLLLALCICAGFSALMLGAWFIL